MNTIECYCLRSFKYSLDGYTEIPVNERETFDLPEKFFDGLNNAKYVRRSTIGDGKVSLKPSESIPSQEELDRIRAEAAAEKAGAETMKAEALAEIAAKEATTETASDVEIPDDWRSLKWFALRSIASKVSSEPIKSMEDAVAAVEAELARRG